MSKAVKTALVTALLLIVLGMALIAVSLLRGANIRELWSSGSFQVGMINTGYGDLKDYTICQSGREHFSADEVKRIDLDWISGKVKLQSGSGDQITLDERCEKSLKDEQKLCWKLENGTLSIRFCSALQTQMPDKELVLTVPAGWTAESVSVGVTSGDVELRGLRVEKTLDLSATSGDMQVFDCSCDKLDAGATSGSVSLTGCDCRELELGATSGAFSAENCRCDTLTATTTSGDISVRCEAKEIRLESTSGSIRCAGVPAGCDVSIDTTSGTVRLSLLDTSSDQRIRVETTSGDVHLDVPGAIDLDFDTASGDMSGRLLQGGSGCPEVEVETTSGDLILGAFD